MFTLNIDKQYQLEFDIDLSAEGLTNSSIKIFDYPEMSFDGRRLKICNFACIQSAAIPNGKWTNVKVLQKITVRNEYSFQVLIDDYVLKEYDFGEGSSGSDQEAIMVDEPFEEFEVEAKFRSPFSTEIGSLKIRNFQYVSHSCPFGYEFTGNNCKIIATWGMWGKWTECHEKCGGGTQSRERECIKGADSNDACEGAANENQNCQTQKCGLRKFI